MHHENLTVTPIGFIRTSKRLKFDTPHQPISGTEEHNRIELLPGKNFDQALKDLSSFDVIWLVWWFHRNTTWRPLVLPPRGPAHRRGVFATRSPHRPNPIGITAVPLIRVEKRTLVVGNCDLLDGTPILDVKPYLSTVDSFPGAALGWTAEVEASLLSPPRYTVQLTPKASLQRAWLDKNSTINFFSKAAELLERDPTPHRTRRIRRCRDGQMIMGCGTWRILFTVSDTTVLITSFEPGYPRRLLLQPHYDQIPDRDAQLQFYEAWGERAGVMFSGGKTRNSPTF